MIMEINGTRAYLDIKEQKASDYSSPIDIEAFDLHSEREAADSEVDRLIDLSNRDPYELSAQERGTVAQDLEKAQIKSGIVRTIAKEKALRAVVKGN